MLNIVIILLTIFDGSLNISKIAKENTLKKDAEIAYKEGRYKDAITNLKTLVDELGVTDEQAQLDLGHAYFKNKDNENAAKVYEKALLSTDKKIKSIASQQLGILSMQADNDKEKALSFFKEALRADPTNAEARHNYELLKKAVDQKKDNKDQQNKDDKNQDKKDQDKKEGDQKDQNKDGKGDQKDDKNKKDGKGDKENDKNNKDNKDGKGDQKDNKDQKGDKGDKDGKGDKKDEKDNKDKNGSDKEGDQKDKEQKEKGDKDGKGEKGENKDSKKEGKEDEQGSAQKEKQGGKKAKDKVVVNPEALAQMGMTEQRAKALLNAMRSNESQYIQQVKREPSKKNKKGKPDW